MDFTKLISRVNYTMGQLITALDMNRMGEVALRNAAHLFGWAHGARKTGTYTSLLVSGMGKTLDFQVTQDSGLTIDVAPGVAMVYDSGAFGGSGDAFESDAYQAIVLDAVFSTTLSTPGSYPRVDVVYAEVESDLDTTDSRFIKSAAIASTSVNTRKVWSALVSVQEGTDGSYAVPAVGGTYVELARILHTGAGAITIYDTRPVLEVSEALKAPPPGVLTGDYVLHDEAAGTASDGLTLVATSPASLTALLKPGIVVQNGRSMRVPFQPLTVSTPDATHPRYDLVSFNNGSITVTAGTPAAVATVPTLPAGHVPIATIYVAASATTVSLFADLREVNTWLTGSEFQSDAVIDGVMVNGLLWEDFYTHVKYISCADFIVDPNTASTPVIDFDGSVMYTSPGGTGNTSTWYIPTAHLPSTTSGSAPLMAEVTVYYERDASDSSDIVLTVQDMDIASGTLAGSVNVTESELTGTAGAATITATVSGAMTAGRAWVISLQIVNAGAVGLAGIRVFGASIKYYTAGLAAAVGGS